MKKKFMILVMLAVVMVFFAACDANEDEAQDQVQAHEPTQGYATTVSFDGDWTPQSIMIDYDLYEILQVSDRPLFSEDGSVNQDVLDSLMEILSDPRLDPMLREPKSEWPGTLPFNDVPYVATTAADFSDFVVPQPDNMSHSGAIAIKLFETIPGRVGVHNGHLTEFTSQWWRLVYRATDDGDDVLTLWMMQPYRITPFGGTRYDHNAGTVGDRYINRFRDPNDGIWNRISPGNINTVLSDERIAMGLPPCNNYFFEGNFSVSIARSNLLRDMEAIFNQFGIESYLVAPRDLPGQWQSSAYQTGANMNFVFFNTGEFYTANGDRGFIGSEDANNGLGATGLIWGTHRHFALINGKDGLSVGPINGHWVNTRLVPTYDDFFWLPSDFEVRTMGFDKDNALFQTFITDPFDRASILRTNTEPENRPDNANGRSGLWRLNGFDRAFDIDGLGLPRGWMTEQVWLRSHDNLGLGNANMVSNTGNRYGYGVNQLAGMRPALHLSIAQLMDSDN